jgi:hypothetical protein
VRTRDSHPNGAIFRLQIPAVVHFFSHTIYVNRRAMDESIQILKQTVQASKVGDKEKTRALQRLRVYVPPDAKNS